MSLEHSPGGIAVFVAALLAVLGGACGTIADVDFGAAHLAPDSLLTGDGGTDEGGARLADGCAPQSCAAQGFDCGVQNDKCGSSLDCGTCKKGTACLAGKCACTPKTCPELGATCGVIDDGCGHSLQCGKCGTATDACVANKCECQPKNCAAAAANCGTIPDGCGNTYDCGMCTPSSASPYCGGGGANKCGATPCVPATCAGHCGDMSDGCGMILHCSGCTAPQTCGGGGAANVCGCTPTTCAQQGKNCSSIPNGCGGTLDCGGCTAPQSCAGGGVANVCGCTPITACSAGMNCGTVPNNCGGNVACGTCTAPNTCAGGGTTNVCGCTPKTCDDFVCGSHPNGCGTGTLNCGSCACFPAGTLITMGDGSFKAIDQIVVGDVVRSADPATGIIGAGRVLERTQHASALSNAGIMVIDGNLRATRNHPILVNGSTVQMEQVQVGDEIVVSDGKGGAMRKRVDTVTIEPGGVSTFDLVIAGGGHYFAGNVMVQQKIIP